MFPSVLLLLWTKPADPNGKYWYRTNAQLNQMPRPRTSTSAKPPTAGDSSLDNKRVDVEKEENTPAGSQNNGVEGKW